MSRVAVLACGLALIVLTPWPAVHAQTPPAAKPQLHAVLIGVDRYAEGIPEAPGSSQEMRRIATWLSEVAGWEPGSVLQLNDSGIAHPVNAAGRIGTLRSDRENIDWAFTSWLPVRVKPGDVVLVAFAGRAATTPDGPVLLPRDADPKALARTAWAPGPDIDRLFLNQRCANVLCWLDAPFTAAPPVEAEGPGALAPDDQLAARLARWPGASVWLASGEPPAAPGGRRFSAALRDALGKQPAPLLASLDVLDRGGELAPLRFRQAGGLPTRFSLFRDLLERSRPPESLVVQTGHADRVTAVAVRTDGQALYTASDDSTIRVWSLADRRPALVQVVPRFLWGVTAMAPSGDGQYLAGGGGNGSLSIVNLADSFAPIVSPVGPATIDRSITEIAFLPEPPADTKRPRLLVTVDSTGGAELWSFDGTLLERRHTLHQAPGLHMAMAAKPDGHVVFALVDAESILRSYDSNGRIVGKPLQLATARPSAVRLTADGHYAAVGDDAGQVELLDLERRVRFFRGNAFAGPIAGFAFAPGGRLAIAAGDGVHWLDVEKPREVVRLPGTEDPAVAVATSADGAWIAGVTRPGDVVAWKASPDGAVPAIVALPQPPANDDELPPAAASLAFGPASAPPQIFAGLDDGGLRRWGLDPLQERPGFAGHEDKVSVLAASSDGRFLLQVSETNVARLWDLEKGRSVRTLSGTWTAGVFRPDGRLLLTRGPNEGGELVLVDRETLRILPDTFPTGAPAGGEAPAPPSNLGRVAVSADGRWIAAAAQPGYAPVVWLWDRKAPATPARALPAHLDTIVGLDFSSDSRFLLTAGSDRRDAVRLHDLQAAGDTPPFTEFRNPRLLHLTAARFSPAQPGRFVMAGNTSSRAGLVLLVDTNAPDQPQRALEGMLDRVDAVSFSSDGRFVAAAGFERRLRIWDVSTSRPVAVEVRSGPEQPNPARPFVFHHNEKINDLVAWATPKGLILASASDDTSVRLWSISAPDRAATLMGTLTTGGGRTAPPAPAAPRNRVASVEEPWAAFTPDGVFDGSQDSDNLVRFVADLDADPLDQYLDLLHRPLLTDELRRGLRPSRKDFTPPPALIIDAPADEFNQPNTRLTVTLNAPEKDPAPELRLYLNGFPIKLGDDFQKGPNPGEYLVDVHLTAGANEIYAMASRAGDVDARSPDLLLEYTGQDPPGRVHVLALGVENYAANKLAFPADDALHMAEFLHGYGLTTSNAAGTSTVLTDSQVNPQSVEKAFANLRKAVRNQHQDTVVVFLAGHADFVPTGVGDPRYSLLLSSYEFPKDAPPLAPNRGPAVADPARRARPGSYLTYATIYRELSHIDALRRLVIIDACQAEAVEGDPGVALVNRVRPLDTEARRQRTAYIFASRRNEPAFESQELESGLLTYLLRRGMSDPGLRAPREGLLPADLPGTADLDGNGVITTAELRRHVDEGLPLLAAACLGGPLRGNAAPVPPPAAAANSAATRSAGASFPLVNLPPRRVALAPPADSR